MKRIFSPTWTVDSIYEIPASDLLSKGYRGVIVDLDNTLLAWNEYVYNQKMSAWVQDMALSGIQVYLLSNNTAERVSKVADPLQLPYSANSLKPFKKNFEKAIEYLQLPKHKVLVVGDQLMTDVIGANFVGLDSILVKPIAQNDIIYTYINRKLERIVMKFIHINPNEKWGRTLD